MPSLLASNLKFVGVVSLGLLTGLNYSLHTVAIPPLLTLPTATTANTTLTTLKAATTFHQCALTLLASSSLLLAYYISPPHSRHPYILWVLLATGAGASVDGVTSCVASCAGGRAGTRGKAREEAAAKRREIVEMDSEEEEELNGEEVREGLIRFRLLQGIKGALWGSGLVMAVVGIWGDGA
ncbi:hypothetical protein P152DRAFT_473630 [Eremomyces bilateralis CBS 781.70]|uniref:Uncharacterized protein n=1 Tax=Eremomyces bilateralis CBS 781.70 TaxID=1392243 RepID=A0A6G1G2W8_9PEZI|nr:uncharacterized protein P152DRAFT_473630 [Eremomyces bilateralis CBS 781.70]KAF1812457.1 hypothetical protein P152DRAFT_473630 [Eremomyces bilateralis CBS 781.70]